MVRVVVAFVFIYAALQAVTWYLAFRGHFAPLEQWTARLTGECAQLAGVPNTVDGHEVFLTTRVLRIDLDCTGVSILTLYAALVLAYPLRARTRLLGLAAGLPVLWVANLVRLVAVAQLSGRLGTEAFGFVHDYLFKVALIAVLIGAWAVYLARARRRAR